LLTERTNTPEVADVVKAVAEVDAFTSNYEDLIWRLVNFDSSLLKHMAEVSEKKDLLATADELVVGEVLIPYIHVFESEGYLYVFGFQLTKLRNATIPIVADEKGLKYVGVEAMYYPLNKANIETSLLLVVNRETPLLERLSPHIPASPQEIRKYIDSSLREARNFYVSLKQTPESKFSDYAFSNGYRSFVVFKDNVGGVRLDFEYFTIDSELWSYYGVNGLFVTDHKHLNKLLSKSNRALEALLALKDVLNKGITYVSAAYLLTKIIENILT